MINRESLILPVGEPQNRDDEGNCYWCGTSLRSLDQSPRFGCKYCQRHPDEREDPENKYGSVFAGEVPEWRHFTSWEEYMKSFEVKQ